MKVGQPSAPAKELVPLTLLVVFAVTSAAGAANVKLPSPTSTSGFVCRLLINEVPFPGERGYRSEKDTLAAMDSILHVLDGRLRHIPKPYTQPQIAGASAKTIIDVIVVGGVRGQVDGFYRDKAGRPATVKRVGERIDRLMQIANRGSPGRFARLLRHAVTISTDYANGRFRRANIHASIQTVNGVPATGRAYAWMTDVPRFHPGGNYLRIPDAQRGALGGNRFFTLRKQPR
jgi:hypothetical protein